MYLLLSTRKWLCSDRKSGKNRYMPATLVPNILIA